jgi:trimethylamine--corrinoid protein Co-methyltransferase
LGDVSCDEDARRVIADVGPGGEFVTHPHTLAHFREAWYPALPYRGGAKAWCETFSAEEATFEARVNRRTCELITSHQPALLPDPRAAQVRMIASRAEAEARRRAMERQR